MKLLLTGSAGHLGEALVRTLRAANHEIVSLDLMPSPFTSHAGSITDRDCVRQCMRGADAVIHTAALHKPHLVTHSRQAFIDTNIIGTLVLLEEALSAGVPSFILTSTTSVFGFALQPPAGAPAAWITEDVRPLPRNIYGATKAGAEDLCELFHRTHGLTSIILRTSRFFPEADDDAVVRDTYQDANAKLNELLYRRVDLQDVVEAHLLAIDMAPAIGFARYIVSATTPFGAPDMPDLRMNAADVVKRAVPGYEEVYLRRAWRMFPGIDRVYVNERARRELGWRPRYDFQAALGLLASGADFRSPLARAVGSKGYHAQRFQNGLYPVP
jgi:nucleoside-diphosphate-sugar epimerase